MTSNELVDSRNGFISAILKNVADSHSKCLMLGFEDWSRVELRAQCARPSPATLDWGLYRSDGILGLPDIPVSKQVGLACHTLRCCFQKSYVSMTIKKSSAQNKEQATEERGRLRHGRNRYCS